jgi:hypothetical protein
MTTRSRLLGIVVALSWLGLSAASAAGGPSKDTWKGVWKFESDRQDRPWLGFSDTRGKTVFRIVCGTHFEMDAVYPGEAPKQEHTQASITIANGKAQMDFAGFTYAGPESFPPNTTMFNQPDLGYPELDEDKWRALENRVLELLGSGQPLTISAEGKCAAAGQGAALAGALPENLLTRRPQAGHAPARFSFAAPAPAVT